MLQPEAVIFDGDGVIFDDIGIRDEIRRRLKEHFHLEREIESCGYEVMAVLSRLGFSREFAAAYLQMWERFETECGVRVFPGVNGLLRELRQKEIVLGIVTNRRVSFHNLRIFGNSGLELNLLDFFIMQSGQANSFFEVWQPGYQSYWHPIYRISEFPKPDHRSVEPALGQLKRLKNFPESVWYVGDSLVDLEFAKGNHFNFVGVLSGAVTDPEFWHGNFADIVVRDIIGLRQVFGLAPAM